MREWAASLRARGGGYRAASLGDDDLLAIVTVALAALDDEMQLEAAIAAK